MLQNKDETCVADESQLLTLRQDNKSQRSSLQTPEKCSNPKEYTTDYARA